MTTTRRFAFAVVFASTVCAMAGTARAQTLEPPRDRQGYYLALGPHFAASQTWESGRDWSVWTGYDVSLRVGQLVTRRLGLGLQAHFGGTSGQGQKVSLLGLGLEGQWEVARHFAVRGSVGVDSVSISMPGETVRGAAGAGYALGLSYDWFLTQRRTGGWALTPVVQARFVPGKADTLIGTVGIEITYWTGLPSNQLELPPSEAFTPR